MKRIVFEQALSATARVACAAALVGCGSTSGYPETDAQDTNTSVDTGLQAEECLDELADQLDTRSWSWEIRDCCETVAVDWEFMNGDPEVHQMCCELLDWDAENFPGCTPWGPPRPPAMGTRLAAARKVRRVRMAALAGVA